MSRWLELRSALLQDFTAAEAQLRGRNMWLMRARAAQLLIEEAETSKAKPVCATSATSWSRRCEKGENR